MKRWLLIVFLWVVGVHPAGAEPVLRWAPADTTIEPGQQATLSVMLDDTLSVRTIELYISYDSDIITSVDGGPGSMFDGYNLFADFQEVDPGNPGRWHGYAVVMDAVNWAVGPGELFRWTIQGDVLGISRVDSVTVTLLPPGGGDYDAVVLAETDIVVALPTPVPVVLAGEAFLSLHPNPFNPRVEVDFFPGAKGSGVLEILDMRGRRVTTLWQGEVAEGERVTWDGRDAQGRALPSGVYTFSLKLANGSRATARGTLVR